MDRSDRLSLLTQATAEATGKRFCAHHQGEVAATDGDFVVRNNTKRWICFRCQKNSQRQSAMVAKRQA
ncbi:hypothetical protein LT85_1929 [Collimonas arenae]|uniref:Uncharacterized protein n=2 Tax=Collimonas arenae TaxID=279058 RepID=A0A0A1FE04_9BURK|nr:hypothetical protein LT85_1929 [Collimonas arenae]